LAATCQVFLHLAGQIDVTVEQKRTEERLTQLEQTVETLRADRARSEYTSKVPIAKQLADERKIHEIEAECESLREMLSSLQDMEHSVDAQTIQKDESRTDKDTMHPLIPIISELTGHATPKEVTDLQAIIECIANQELMGGPQVKQWLSWSIHLHAPQLRQTAHFERSSTCFREMLSARLHSASCMYLAHTSHVTLADLGAVLALVTLPDHNSWIRNGKFKYVAQWIDRIKDALDDKPSVSISYLFCPGALI
uniref:GST C-terminal domain-containing protein n=1 Tax=Echinostoma caproni TaxID=27848 RepID=A0A183BG51_9TREM